MLVGVLLLPASSSASATGSATTGRYVGKTSQKQPIRFKIASAKCDSPRPPYAFHKGICFEGEIYNAHLQSYYPRVLEPCSDHSTFSDPLYAASYRLSLTSSGALSWTVKGLGSTLTPDGSVSTLTLKVKHSSVTGSLRQTESYDAGNGPIHCDSHVVKFTAHRVG
jgi:hypothetical protein